MTYDSVLNPYWSFDEAIIGWKIDFLPASFHSGEMLLVCFFGLVKNGLIFGKATSEQEISAIYIFDTWSKGISNENYANEHSIDLAALRLAFDRNILRHSIIFFLFIKIDKHAQLVKLIT